MVYRRRSCRYVLEQPELEHKELMIHYFYRNFIEVIYIAENAQQVISGEYINQYS